MIKLEPETAVAGAAILGLLHALGEAIPEIGELIARGATRVTFDMHELVLLVHSIESDGQSAVLLALRCDPADPDSFGVLSLPVAVSGMYGRPSQSQMH